VGTGPLGRGSIGSLSLPTATPIPTSTSTATPTASIRSALAALAAAVAALGQGRHHFTALELELLPLAPQIQGDEMAQMLQGNVTPQLQLERDRPAAVGTGLLAHLHHQLTGFRPGEDQFSPD
jgi:hypothetical protein